MSIFRIYPFKQRKKKSEKIKNTSEYRNIHAMVVEKGSVLPELLVTDVRMPGMNGYKLHQRLREKNKHVKVIYISGYPDDVIMEKGVDKKEVTSLQKPFTLESVSQAIKRVLK